MNRRQIVSLLGAAAAHGPRLRPWRKLCADSPGRPRRVGLMVATAENDPEGKLRVETFTRSLGEAGWVDGRDVDHRCRVVPRQLPGGADRGQGPRRSRRRGARRERHAGHGCRAGTGCDGLEHTDRFRRRQQSGRRGVRAEPVAAGRQHHRLQHVRAGDRRQVAPAPQGGGARHAKREHAARPEVHWLQLPAGRPSSDIAPTLGIVPHAAYASSLARSRAPSRLSPSSLRPASSSVQARSIPSIASV